MAPVPVSGGAWLSRGGMPGMPGRAGRWGSGFAEGPEPGAGAGATGVGAWAPGSRVAIGVSSTLSVSARTRRIGMRASIQPGRPAGVTVVV